MACLPLLLHALAQPRVRIPSAGVQVINAKTGGQLSCLVEGQDEDTVRAEITDPSLGRVLRRIVTQCCKPNVAGSGACVRVYNRGRSCTSGKPPAEPITKRTYAEAVAACAEIGRNEEGVPYLSAIRQPVRAKAACIRSTRLARALGAPRPLLLRQQPKISTALRHHRHRRHQSTGRRGTMSRCPRCTVICVPDPVRIAFPIPIPFPLFLPLSA